VFKIRKTLEDRELPALYEIERECFTREFRWTQRAFNKEIKSAAAKDKLYIATLVGRLAGYLLAGEENGRIHIETVNISRLHRRKGIASKLIAACEADARKQGFKEIKLEVHTDNPAYILYFNLGYRVVAFKRHYYRLNSHALSMQKTL
jgi:ribosomal protein S18 acetylase RimI-like enzyme